MFDVVLATALQWFSMRLLAAIEGVLYKKGF